MPTDKENSAIALIVSQKAVEEQGLSGDECYEMALKNTPLIIQNMYGMNVVKTTEFHNKELYGAAAIIKFNALAEADGETYVIIPSSVHEMIVMPLEIEEANKADVIAYLLKQDDMVRHVNNSELTPDRILSDHAYVWSKGQFYSSALEFAQVLKKEVNCA